MIQMSIDEWLDKQNMVLCGNGMLFNNLKMNYGSDNSIWFLLLNIMLSDP